MVRRSRLPVVLAFGLFVSVAHAQTYVIVLDRSEQGARYEPAAKALAELRQPATIVPMGDDGLGPVFVELKRLAPCYVAFVVPPGRIEDNFVGEVFERATRLNDDPLLDFSYGFITGAEPADALKLVRETERAEKKRDSIPRKFVGVGHTFREADLGMFAIQNAAQMKLYGFDVAEINPIDESAEWRARERDEMRKLDGASLVYFAGHGMGEQLCGVDAARFEGFTLDRAVIVNGACHSAVCLTRHDISPTTMGIETVRFPPERSICLRLIHAGAIAQLGSTASSSWMNVGPAIDAFFLRAERVGDALRERLNAYIRQEGLQSIHVIPFRDGEPSPQFLGPDKNPGQVQSISRVVLIGDPAYRPFVKPRQPVAMPQVADRPHPMGEKRVAAGPAKPLAGLTIAELIQQLETPSKPGFEALNEIIGRGPEAVQPLIDALPKSKSWQVAKALGALKDSQAVTPLIDALARDRSSPMKDVVAEALQLITTKDLGDDPAAWRAWQGKEAGAGKR
jgi:hypothetical protein